MYEQWRQVLRKEMTLNTFFNYSFFVFDLIYLFIILTNCLNN